MYKSFIKKILQLDLGFMIDANKFTIYMNEIVNAVNYVISIIFLENLVKVNVALEVCGVE